MKEFTEFKADSEEINELLVGNEPIGMRGLSLEDKVDFFRYCFSREDVTNSNVIVNLTLLILGGNFDDNVFEREDMYFTSLREYLDIKTALKADINSFCNQLAKYFMGAIKGYYSLLPDNKVPVPVVHGSMLSVMSPKQISKLFAHADFNIKEIPQVENSKGIIDGFCIRNNLAKGFSDLFFNEQKE